MPVSTIHASSVGWTRDPRLTHLAQVVKTYKEQLDDFAPPTDFSAERGIVICAGGESYLTQAFMSMVLLREVHNCTLPIELVYAGDGEMPSTTRRLFQERFSDLRCIDALATLTHDVVGTIVD